MADRDPVLEEPTVDLLWPPGVHPQHQTVDEDHDELARSGAEVADGEAGREGRLLLLEHGPVPVEQLVQERRRPRLEREHTIARKSNVRGKPVRTAVRGTTVCFFVTTNKHEYLLAGLLVLIQDGRHGVAVDADPSKWRHDCSLSISQGSRQKKRTDHRNPCRRH